MQNFKGLEEILSHILKTLQGLDKPHGFAASMETTATFSLADRKLGSPALES